MTAGRKAEIGAAIAAAVVKTEEEIRSLEAKLEPVAPDCSLGRLTRIEAMGEQQVYGQTLDEAKKRLARLKYASTRVEHASFGICESCEEPIAIARLLIVPESTLCVACANMKGR